MTIKTADHAAIHASKANIAKTEIAPNPASAAPVNSAAENASIPTPMSITAADAEKHAPPISLVITAPA